MFLIAHADVIEGKDGKDILSLIAHEGVIAESSHVQTMRRWQWCSVHGNAGVFWVYTRIMNILGNVIFALTFSILSTKVKCHRLRKTDSQPDPSRALRRACVRRQKNQNMDEGTWSLKTN